MKGLIAHNAYIINVTNQVKDSQVFWGLWFGGNSVTPQMALCSDVTLLSDNVCYHTHSSETYGPLRFPVRTPYFSLTNKLDCCRQGGSAQTKEQRKASLCLQSSPKKTQLLSLASPLGGWQLDIVLLHEDSVGGGSPDHKVPHQHLIQWCACVRSAR